LDDGRSRYTFGGKLGEGVYGEVYEGFRSGRLVAIKFIKACDDARTDAAAEAYVLDRCRGHPNIVQLVDVFRGLGPDMPGLSFALVFQHAGVALTSIMRRETLSCQAVRSAMADIVAGVGHLHGLGLVHGDLKPCNLLATAVGGFVPGGGDRWHVKVGDVGLAVLASRAKGPNGAHN
jgi:cyclin-dependent kinase/cell division cycle 2-like protein